MTRYLALGLCAAVLLMLTAGGLLLNGRCPGLSARGQMMGAAQSGKVICIYTQEELRAIGGSRASLGARYVLGRDIVVTGKWEPIGSRTRPFTGSLDGNGHVIYGLSLKNGRHGALFGAARNAEIRNVTLTRSELKTVLGRSAADRGIGAKIREHLANVAGISVVPDAAAAI